MFYSFLYILFALVMTLIIGGLIGALIKILSGSLRESFPLTPRRRVSHLVCDSLERLDDTVFRRVFFAVLLSPIIWQVWSEKDEEDLSLTGFWVLPSIVLLFELVAIYWLIKLVICNVKRDIIVMQLDEEQRRWDPNLANPKVFVIKRDTVPDAVELYDRITRACYERGISLLQYTNFEWPVYRHSLSRMNSEAVLEEVPNPKAVAMGDAVLWLDIGEQSKAMRLELDEARALGRMIVHLTYYQGGGNDFMVEAESGILKRIPKSDVPECVRDLFHLFFISKQVRQPDTQRCMQPEVKPMISQEAIDGDREE